MHLFSTKGAHCYTTRGLIKKYNQESLPNQSFSENIISYAIRMNQNAREIATAFYNDTQGWVDLQATSDASINIRYQPQYCFCIVCLHILFIITQLK